MPKETEAKCHQQCIKAIGCSESDYSEALRKKTRTITYQKDETIFKQGSFANQVACINKGVVKLQVNGANNAAAIIQLASAEELIGLISLTGHIEYPWSAIAMKETSVCLFQADFIKQIMTRLPEAQNFILSAFGKTSRQLSQKIAAMAFYQMRGRLAQTLLYLNQQNFTREHIFQYISRREIADITGMSLESITKILKEFRNDNLVAMKKNGQIEVKQPEVLQEVAARG